MGARRPRPIADLAEISRFWSEVMRDPAEDIKNRIKVSELLAKVGGLEEDLPVNPFCGLTTAQLRRLCGQPAGTTDSAAIPDLAVQDGDNGTNEAGK